MPPPGYVATLEVDVGEQRVQFGPFVGYYFKPVEPGDFQRVSFVCFNERRFYTTSLPANQLLFRGQGVFTQLPEANIVIPQTRRINPVPFAEAPRAWIDTRPEPQDEFRHFHSCYDQSGTTRYGFWLRHVAEQEFVYDMGGRVAAGSVLYHQVEPGVDTGFAQIVEFDQGPDRPTTSGQ